MLSISTVMKLRVSRVLKTLTIRFELSIGKNLIDANEKSFSPTDFSSDEDRLPSTATNASRTNSTKNQQSSQARGQMKEGTRSLLLSFIFNTNIFCSKPKGKISITADYPDQGCQIFRFLRKTSAF